MMLVPLLVRVAQSADVDLERVEKDLYYFGFWKCLEVTFQITLMLFFMVVQKCLLGVSGTKRGEIVTARSYFASRVF